MRQHWRTSRTRLSTVSRDFRVRSSRRATSSSWSIVAKTVHRQPLALASRGSASRIFCKRQRTFTACNGYTETTHSGSTRDRHRLPTTPAHRERACAVALVKRQVFQVFAGLNAYRTTTRARRWRKFPVQDSTVLPTGPYTTGVNSSRIGLVRSPYPRETSSKNPSAHRTGAGCAYGSPAVSIYRVWRIANAAG